MTKQQEVETDRDEKGSFLGEVGVGRPQPVEVKACGGALDRVSEPSGTEDHFPVGTETWHMGA